MNQLPTSAKRAAAPAARFARVERCAFCGDWTLVVRACGACARSPEQRAESVARMRARDELRQQRH